VLGSDGTPPTLLGYPDRARSNTPARVDPLAAPTRGADRARAAGAAWQPYSTGP